MFPSVEESVISMKIMEQLSAQRTFIFRLYSFFVNSSGSIKDLLEMVIR